MLGSSTAAVAAALELRAAGRDVLLVGEGSYFGEESAGVLALHADLSPDQSEPLLAALARAARDGLLFPSAIKRTLDAALLEAGARALLCCRPVAVLRDTTGRLSGLVLTHRGALLAVCTPVMLDFTGEGLLARLAAVPLHAARDLSGPVEWRVLARSAPRTITANPVGRTFEVPADNYAASVGLYSLRLPRHGGDRREQLHHLRAALLDASISQTADLPIDVTPFAVAPAVALRPAWTDLPDEIFQPEPGLLLGGGVLPLSAAGVLATLSPDAQCAMGRHIARLADRAIPDAGRARPASALAQAGGTLDTRARVSPAFVRDTAGSLQIAAPLFDDWGSWDVVVAGGGTGGAPAALSAARAGARTLVVEAQLQLGGVGTAGLIAQYWFGRRVGYTAEFDALLRELEPDRTQHARWNPELKAGLLHRLLRDAGVTAWMRSFVFGARRDSDRLSGLLVSTPYGCGFVASGCVVDATGSSDVAAAAGASCRVVDHTHAAVQGTGLPPRSPARGYCNSDHTFVDDNDPEGVTHAHMRAHAKFAREFDTASFVDSRERRQIVGDLELTPLDLLGGRTFPDTIATAHSNFDTHGFIVHPVFMLTPPDKKPLDAHVPLRALLPAGLDGILVTGLGVSAHRDVLPVIRMQADVQNQGYAAGLIAATSARRQAPLRSLDLRSIQRRLVEHGLIAAEVVEHGDSFPLPDSALKDALGRLTASYRDSALVLAHIDRTRDALRDSLGAPERAHDAALALGLMGDPAAAPVLLAHVARTPWDEGWHYLGMGQWGASVSPLDAAIIALGRTRAPGACDVLIGKIRALAPVPVFSHARAVGVAAACLRDPRLAAPLHALLSAPGVGGHAERSTLEACRAAIPAYRNEDPPRSAALTELYLARGLLACGDHDGLGRRTLEAYAQDLRGVFARHARAVLARGLPDDHLLIA